MIVEIVQMVLKWFDLLRMTMAQLNSPLGRWRAHTFDALQERNPGGAVEFIFAETWNLLWLRKEWSYMSYMHDMLYCNFQCFGALQSLQ